MTPRLTLEQLRQRGAGRFPDLVGLLITRVDSEGIGAELAVRPQLLAPNGYLHAGAVVTLADTLCGYGCIATLPGGATGFTTIELKSNFLGTAREGMIDCDARPQHMGRTTQVWDATVRDRAGGKTIALFRCTQMILYPSSSPPKE
jgi:1,4-dihydroxy-2-naphthoyl-CoA hydrolase